MLKQAGNSAVEGLFAAAALTEAISEVPSDRGEKPPFERAARGRRELSKLAERPATFVA